MDLDQPGAGWASGPQFDPDLLRLYYARLFPYDQWCKWMAYNSDEPGTGSQLARRELSLTLADDVYIRYQCFTNGQRNENADDGGSPQDRYWRRVQLRAPGSFEREELPAGIEELVFDIDLSDYDDVARAARSATRRGK